MEVSNYKSGEFTVNYRGYTYVFRPWPMVKVFRNGELVKVVQANEGETMGDAARAYIDFLYDSEENDRALEAAKENYEEEQNE